MKMNRTNTAGRILALLLTALMVLSLAACGTKGGDKMDGMSSEPKNAEEAVAMHKELMAQENAILSEDTALWEKVFMAADKGMTMQEDGKNYGEFLLDTIESAKDQFTDEEYEMLKESATEISNIENKLTMIEKKYPEAAQQSLDSDMSVPAGSDMTTPPDDGSMQKFPAFEGKDLDGNTVKSDELFRQRRHRGEFLVHHLQSLRGRAFRAGRTEQGACEEGRRTHRCQHLHIGWRRSGNFRSKRCTGQERRDLPECVFRFRRRGGKVHYKHFCLPHHLCG